MTDGMRGRLESTRGDWQVPLKGAQGSSPTMAVRRSRSCVEHLSWMGDIGSWSSSSDSLETSRLRVNQHHGQKMVRVQSEENLNLARRKGRPRHRKGAALASVRRARKLVLGSPLPRSKSLSNFSGAEATFVETNGLDATEASMFGEQRVSSPSMSPAASPQGSPRPLHDVLKVPARASLPRSVADVESLVRAEGTGLVYDERMLLHMDPSSHTPTSKVSEDAGSSSGSGWCANVNAPVSICGGFGARLSCRVGVYPRRGYASGMS